MMQFEDYVNWRNSSMRRFWQWYMAKFDMYSPAYRIQKANARAFLTSVIEREWEIQEYDAI